MYIHIHTYIDMYISISISISISTYIYTYTCIGENRADHEERLRPHRPARYRGGGNNQVNPIWLYIYFTYYILGIYPWV